ncbi:MAG: S-layer homology domain-containing protein, partial [Oscillospiraceae bacterium]
MKLKRLLAAFLTAAAVCTLMAVPAQASSFPDISNPAVSRSADTLYALGIVNGMEDGTFRPEGHLSRVQFCKMAIEIMGKGDEARAQMNRTI